MSGGGRKKRRQMDALFGHHESRRSIDMRRSPSQEQINNSESSREHNLRLEVAGDDEEFFAN